MKEHLESSIFGEHDGLDEPGADSVEPPPVLTSRRQVRELEAAARDGGRRRGGGRGRGPGGGRGHRGRPGLLRRVVVIILALAVVGGGVSVAYSYLRPVVEGILAPNDYAGPGSGSVRVTVEEGAGGAAIGQMLADDGVVKSSKAFIEAAKADPKSAGIQPGVYQMRKQMKASDALAILVDPANRIVTRVVVPEGKWATEIFAILSNATGIPVAEYTTAAKDSAGIGLPDAAKGNVEGYLFPASYEFPPGSTAKDQLALMVSQSKSRLDALGVTPADMERIVVVASLIEAEAHRPEDQAKVSRVIANRLAKNMTLGLDSTVNYIFQKRGVPTKDMLDKDSPYNTRLHPGLPPGPIGNPGDAAIKAAVAPAPGPWLYFVTVNLKTGETLFTDSDAEFQKYAAQFAGWCKANPGAC